MENETVPSAKPTGFVDRALDLIERIGNKLPDPAALFLILLFVVWICSAIFSGMSFAELDPRSQKPIVVNNLLTGTALYFFRPWSDLHGISAPRGSACPSVSALRNTPDLSTPR